MASRELNILIAAKNLTGRAFGEVRGEMRGLQSEARRGVANITRNVGLATVAAAGLVATQVKAGLDSLAELERVNAQTAAVLRSTNNAAGISAGQVRTMAEELENLTTVDDKAIQNTENLLLTFTNVDKKAFRPALETILDMNAALGGDEESLQGVAIQVGKALQDPTRGLTALRRVGVAFSKDQEKQIKALVASNDLYGAQQIILAELAKEFGGSAAAQADTFGGKMRRVADAVEDAQMALATAFLPLIEKVADKLGTFLQDPNTIKNIEAFGQTLAEGLDDAIDVVSELPWDSIGAAFELMGKGAKAALDLFLSAPPWLQTAVITGWGLNKLTGGALGTIVGTLGAGLIKGVLGMNAGVVNINAGVVNGGVGGSPIAGGAGFTISKFLGVATAALLGYYIGKEIGDALFYEPTVGPTRERVQSQVNQVTANPVLADRSRIEAGIAEIDRSLLQFKLSPLMMQLKPDEYQTLVDQKAVLEAALGKLDVIATQSPQLVSQFERSRATSEDLLRLNRTENDNIRQMVAKTEQTARWGGKAADLLTGVLAKDFSPNLAVTAMFTANVTVSASQVIKTTTRIESGIYAGKLVPI